MEMEQFKCLLGVDYNKNAIKTFAKNHKYASTYCGDISKLTNQKINELLKGEKIDLVIGGPPCQGFSTIGQGNPKDNRNNLFLEFLRIVKFLNPIYLVIENVTGLFAKKNESTLNSILTQFSSLGYNMDVQVLSAQNYGVAERRRRTIFIGSKVNQSIIFPQKTHDTIIGDSYIPPVTIGEILCDLKNKDDNIFNHDLKFSLIKSNLEKRRIKRIPEGRGIRYKKDEEAYFTKSLKLNIDWENIREKRLRQTQYQRLDRKSISPTIVTNPRSYYHPCEHRYLTIREAAKIQSFPNDFQFEGPKTSQWLQVGNAVPPLMSKAIAVSIKKMYHQYLRKENIQSHSEVKIKQSIKKIRGEAFVYK